MLLTLTIAPTKIPTSGVAKRGGIVYLNELNGGETIMGNPIATVASLVKVGINNFNPGFALDVVQASGRGLILVASNFANWGLKTGPALAPGSYQLLYYGEGGNPIGSWHPQTAFMLRSPTKG